VQKITESIGSKGVIVLVHGRSGSGKTATCRNLPPAQTYFLSFELDQTAACLFGWGWDEWNCETPFGHMSMIHEIQKLKKRPDIKYVVVDTISGYVEQLLDEYRNEHEGKTKKQLGFAIWQAAEERLLDTLTKLQELAQYGKHVILLCHLKYREEGEKESKKIYREPMLFGSLPEKLCKRIPVILIAKSFKMGPKVVYTLSTTGNEGDYATDKFKILDQSQDNDIKAVIEKIEQGLGLPPIPTETGPYEETHVSNANPSTASQDPTNTPKPKAPALLVTNGTKASLVKEIYRLGGELGRDSALVRMSVKARFDRTISQLNREELREYVDALKEEVDSKDKETKEMF
jgi:hypothetical protein